MKNWKCGSVLMAAMAILAMAVPVPARVISRRVSPTDIAGTLAAYIGVKPPSGAIGVVLEEVFP